MIYLVDSPFFQGFLRKSRYVEYLSKPDGSSVTLSVVYTAGRAIHGLTRVLA